MNLLENKVALVTGATSGLNEPATAAAWQRIPSWVVIGAEDKAIPPAGQRFTARRAGARVTGIPGAPHVSMLPFPKQVAAVIEAAAR
jgi:pimeloyl-ACP methyl ester carboxylesterase